MGHWAPRTEVLSARFSSHRTVTSRRVLFSDRLGDTVPTSPQQASSSNPHVYGQSRKSLHLHSLPLLGTLESQGGMVAPGQLERGSSAGGVWVSQARVWEAALWWGHVP